MVHEFPCGTRALDFIGTLRARRIDEPFEFLTSAEMLDAWFDESGLVPGGVGAGEADLASALELREAAYALIWSRLHGRPMPLEAIDVVNSYAAKPPVRIQLGSERWTSAGDAAQALSQLARETIEIAGGDETHLLRECGRDICTQIYLDHSRGRRREWCSMSSCGSRMKAKAYRERKKAQAGT
jgi:predicted RNA-binding Zn ribbon-like protein